MKINDNLIHFLQRQNYVIVSTIDKNGAIHNSCKGIVEVDPNGSIYLLDLYKQRTYNNLKNNSHIALTAVDEHQFKGYSLKGDGKIVSEDRIQPKVMSAWEKKITGRISQRILKNVEGKKGHPKHPEMLFPMPEYAIEMKVNSVVDLTPHILR